MRIKMIKNVIKVEFYKRLLLHNLIKHHPNKQVFNMNDASFMF